MIASRIGGPSSKYRPMLFPGPVHSNVIGISGTVTELGTPVSRVVLLYSKDDYNLVAQTMSDPTTGYYFFSQTNPNKEFFVVTLDDAAGVDYQALICDRVHAE